ncbi:MAG: tRNA uridine-5-carboxymethylaminomethyl(34) synthesis GTPase MnmE, partial [Bacteroidales bacterium]|nr:tRNA uridine-5-carboxymethylaminomethyl(34) synthesis GTPase MnmE [Bacteroidales bacterium]
MLSNTTITAICTGHGGAIAVLRVSGNDTLKIVSSIFKPLKKGFSLASDAEGNRIYNGYITDNDGNEIDRVVVSVYLAPHSYTGEDVVEISCHASSYIQKEILNLLIKNGVQLAKPGEFTRRAFQNKKMDLSQAEAVADLIASKSKAEHDIAVNQMRG